MNRIINLIVLNWKLILDIVAYVIAAASIIVRLTPTPKDDTILAFVIDILKKLSLYKEV